MSQPVSLVKTYAPKAGTRPDERLPHAFPTHLIPRYRPFIGRWPS